MRMVLHCGPKVNSLVTPHFELHLHEHRLRWKIEGTILCLSYSNAWNHSRLLNGKSHFHSSVRFKVKSSTKIHAAKLNQLHGKGMQSNRSLRTTKHCWPRCCLLGSHMRNLNHSLTQTHHDYLMIKAAARRHNYPELLWRHWWLNLAP